MALTNRLALVLALLIGPSSTLRSAVAFDLVKATDPIVLGTSVVPCLPISEHLLQDSDDTLRNQGQSISFTSTVPSSAAVGRQVLNVNATATSSLPVVSTINASASAFCAITGATVSIIANQAGNGNCNAAPQVQYATAANIQQSFSVQPGKTTSFYTTNFANAENPISEGGKWINGKAVGLAWNNVQSGSGKAHASIISGASGNRYDDSIAHLSTSVAQFEPNQFAQGTVYRAAGYAPGRSYYNWLGPLLYRVFGYSLASPKHEVELLLRFQITPNSARGYEVLWGYAGDLAVVRWNGPLGNYTPLLETGNPGIGPPVDGDVLRAEIVGGVINVYKNGLLVVTGPSDTTWVNGQPGMGFWPVGAAVPNSFGWKKFTAGNL